MQGFGGSPNINEVTDFRLFLREELLRRCKQNPSYSLRAFARTLGLESSYLSKLVRGNRTITKKVVDRIGFKLGLDPDEIDRFKSKIGTDSSTERTETNFRQLAYDSFKLISDWYHYAILELITVEGFRADHKWIAKSLNINVTEVQSALERLVRLGLLEQDKNGKWETHSANNTTINLDYSEAALKSLQQQILEKAIVSLQEIPLDQRDQSAMTMAIDSKLLPEAKKKIRTFRRDLCAFLQDGRKRDQVFHLSVSLYPVSKKSIEEKGSKKKGQKK